MAEKTILVCDVCGEPATQSVVLLLGARRLRKDYCPIHLTELLSGARPARGSPGTAAARGRKAKAPVARSRSKAATGRRGPRAVGADVAVEVTKLKREGKTYRQIGQTLLDRGIRPPRAKSWNPVVLGRLVKRQSAA